MAVCQRPVESTSNYFIRAKRTVQARIQNTTSTHIQIGNLAPAAYHKAKNTRRERTQSSNSKSYLLKSTQAFRQAGGTTVKATQQHTLPASETMWPSQILGRWAACVGCILQSRGSQIGGEGSCLGMGHTWTEGVRLTGLLTLGDLWDV